MSDPDTEKEDNQTWEPKIHTLPSSWVQLDFDQAFESLSINKKKVPAKSYLAEGSLPVVDQGQSFIGGYTNNTELAIDPGDSGVVIFGDHTRIFKRVNFPFAPGADGIKVLRSLYSDSAYAHYACQSLQLPNKGYSRHYSYLKKCKFPIAPLLEQDRIVSKIDELFSRIEEGEEALDQVQKLVAHYRQSVLKAAVTGELTREWREKYKGQFESAQVLLERILKAHREAWEQAELEKMRAKGKPPTNDNWKQKYKRPAPPDTTDLPALPEGWIWACIGQLFEVAVGSTPSRKKPEYWNRDIPWVSSGEVAFCRIQKTKESISTAGFDNSSVKLHPPGTVLLAMIGEGKTRGQAAILDIAACHNQNSASISVSATPIPPEYVYSYLQYRYEIVRAIGRGGNQPALNRGLVKSIAIPVPPLPEMLELCDVIDRQLTAILKIEEALESQMPLVQAQKQSVLREAFRGSLVPQEPTDETAAAFIEHIAAERAAACRSRKKRA